MPAANNPSFQDNKYDSFFTSDRKDILCHGLIFISHGRAFLSHESKKCNHRFLISNTNNWFLQNAIHIMNHAFWNQLYFVLLMKSHLESYPCPLINDRGQA